MHEGGALQIGADSGMFERVVEALCFRGFDEVRAINGKGGDGGADIVWSNKRVVVQLKFFPQGIGSKRHRQIKGSWRRALDTHPELEEWILAVPCKLSQHDWKLIDQLAKEGRHRGTRVTVWDRPHLDNALAGHKDLVNYFRRTDYVVESAAILNKEQAVMTGGGMDLAARTAALADRADQLNPNWGLDFSYDGRRPNIRFRPKHPDAHLIEPIHLVAHFSAEGGREEDRSKLHDSLAFGFIRELVLEPPILEAAGFTGPPELGLPDLQPATLRLGPSVSPLGGKPVAITLYDPDGGAATHTGRVETSAVGADGGTLVLQFYGCLTLEYRVPREQGRCRTRINLQLVGHFPAAGSSAADLVLQMIASTSSRLSIDGSNHDLGNASSHVDIADLQALQTLAAGIARLQAHTGTFFALSTVPDPQTQDLIRAFVQPSMAYLCSILAMHRTAASNARSSRRALLASKPASANVFR